MSNWVTVTLADLQAAKADAIIEQARTISLAEGQADPVPPAIADVTNRIQTAVRAGNALDFDRTKIPAALRELAVRMVIRRLKGRVEGDLTPAEQQDQRDDLSYLNRIMDQRTSFDRADNPDLGSSAGASPSPGIQPRRRRFTHHAEDGL